MEQAACPGYPEVENFLCTGDGWTFVDSQLACQNLLLHVHVAHDDSRLSIEKLQMHNDGNCQCHVVQMQGISGFQGDGWVTVLKKLVVD